MCRFSISLASSSYWSLTTSRSSAVRAAGSPGAQTTGSMESSVKPRSAIWKRSFVKSGFRWVKVPRI